MESKSSQQSADIAIPKAASGDAAWVADSESSQTGGFSVGFSLTVIQVGFRFAFACILLFVNGINPTFR